MSNIIYDYPKTSCIKSCDQTYPFYIQNTPNNLVFLNPDVISDDKFNNTYNKINVKNCPRSACNGVTYLNSDPRLYNAAAGTWLQLDRPPLYSTLKLNDIPHDKSLNCYGKSYNSYADVNTGQILYYTDRNSKDLNFPSTTTASCNMYTSPMSTSKPYLDLTSKQDYNPITDDTCDVTGSYCLSWIRDSQFQRDDILAFKMRGLNANRRYS